MLGPYVRGYHAGVDYGCPQGTMVSAAAAGAVLWSGIDPLLAEYGLLLRLTHPGSYESWYAHLSDVEGMVPGLRVGAGENIALSGNTGRTSGPHLHFELRRDGEPVCPTPYMEPQTES